MKCKDCDEEKDLNEFYICSGRLRLECKECFLKKYKKKPEYKKKDENFRLYCIICREYKQEEDFYKGNSNRRCKFCHKKIMMSYNLNKKYGIKVVI